MSKNLLMISIDRKIFEEGSNVRTRQIEYAKDWDEVHIIIATDRSFKEVHIAPNIWVYPTRSRSKLLYPFDAARLGRFIAKRKIISLITCQDPFLTAMAGVTLKKEMRVLLEIQVHTDIGSPNYAYTLSNKYRKYLALSYLPKADFIRVASQRIKDYLVSVLHLEEKKITVRPIKVDVEWIRNAPITADLHQKYPQFEKVVLMASRLEKEKNIELALHSWKKVAEKIPKAGLIIVGSGSEESHLRGLTSRLNLGKAVVIEPWADKQMLASYYKTADVFLNTSLFEGYGMTLVEAKAADCPIISTDVGVAREIGANIIKFEANDVAEKIIYKIMDSRLRGNDTK